MFFWLFHVFHCHVTVSCISCISLIFCIEKCFKPLHKLKQWLCKGWKWSLKSLHLFGAYNPRWLEPWLPTPNAFLSVAPTSSDVANGMLWLHSKLFQIVGRLKTSLIRQVPVQRKWLQLLYRILPGLRIPTEKLSWTWGRWPSHSCTDPRQTDLTNHQYWWPVLIERGKCWPWEEYSCPKRPLLANWTQNHNQTLQSLSAEASHIQRSRKHPQTGLKTPALLKTPILWVNSYKRDPGREVWPIAETSSPAGTIELTVCIFTNQSEQLQSDQSECCYLETSNCENVEFSFA